MIWEYTWPKPQIIETVICKDETTEEYIDIAVLRPAGPLSVCLDEKGFWLRVIEASLLE
jgi:hypothetical protein